MKTNEIKTLSNLCEYINNSEDWPLDVEEICEQNGWEFGGHSDYDIAIDHENGERLEFSGAGKGEAIVTPYYDEISMEDLAYEQRLSLIETTDARNGYPQNIQQAVIGFETFEEAEKLAQQYDLKVTTLEKRDGWQLWYRTGSTELGPIEPTAEMYGDDYMIFDSETTAQKYFDEEVKRQLEDVKDMDELEEIVRKAKEVMDELEIQGYDELVLTRNGEYINTIEKQTMEWSYDTHIRAIGLIEK